MGHYIQLNLYAHGHCMSRRALYACLQCPAPCPSAHTLPPPQGEGSPPSPEASGLLYKKGGVLGRVSQKRYMELSGQRLRYWRPPPQGPGPKGEYRGEADLRGASTPAAACVLLLGGADVMGGAQGRAAQHCRSWPHPHTCYHAPVIECPPPTRCEAAPGHHQSRPTGPAASLPGATPRLRASPPPSVVVGPLMLLPSSR